MIHDTGWFVLSIVVVALATYRVTRLIIEDDILEPIRERTVYRLDSRSKLRALLDCPWCLSVWLGVVATLLIWAIPVMVVWLALPFAISAVVGVLASHESD